MEEHSESFLYHNLLSGHALMKIYIIDLMV